MRDMLNNILLEGAHELIRNLGGDPDAIAAHVCLPVGALAARDIPVRGQTLTDFFEAAAEACDCDIFGLLMAERSSLAVTGPVWSLLETAPTIGAMVEDLVGHFGVYSEAAVVALSRSDDGVLMSFEGRVGPRASELQMVEYALAITCNELRRHCPADWQPTTVLFRHPAPARVGAHQRVFGPHLMFEQDRNAIYLDAATLQQPRLPGGALPRKDVQRRLRLLLEEVRPSATTRVDIAIRACNELAQCSLPWASATLGIPRRSLQRMLAQEATSFQQLLDNVRADRALKYVRQSHLPFGEIAEILGYSELSAFTRAFKRWHGYTAMAMRGSVKS